jgi:hypothetical protein
MAMPALSHGWTDWMLIETDIKNKRSKENVIMNLIRSFSLLAWMSVSCFYKSSSAIQHGPNITYFSVYESGI